MSEQHRWVKFWFQDWENDPALKICSFAAQGFWMRLLCRMNAGEPHGMLTINGLAPSHAQIAAIVGATESQVAKLLGELGKAGVYSVENGIIYNRRMRRDLERTERGREFGKLGGNPNLTRKSTSKVVAITKKGVKGASNPEAEADKEERKKDSPSLRSGPEPTEIEFIDIRDQLWVTGPPLLQSLTGLPERKAKSLLGRLLKTAADDCSVVLDALRTAVEARPVQPVAWLTAACVGTRRNLEDRRGELWDLPKFRDDLAS